MRHICIILFLGSIFVPIVSSAQTYCHIWGDFTGSQKSIIKDDIEKSAKFFDIQDVTFAVIKCRLPNTVNATTEYEDNKIVQRKMILFRINDCVKPEEYNLLIAHEMIHAYQFYTGQLIRHDRYTYTWQGVRFEKVHRIHHHKRPWEIEAMEQAEYLLAATEQHTIEHISKIFP